MSADGLNKNQAPQVSAAKSPCHENSDEMAMEMDEYNRCNTQNAAGFHVLKELDANLTRIKLKAADKIRLIEDGRKYYGEVQNPKTFYFEVEGDYFPDYFEESKLYFVSLAFFEYLNYKFASGLNQYNRVGLVSEGGKRIEEYYLIIPREVDCILGESVQYDINGVLNYFEIEAEKVKDLEIFKVKGFSHLITTKKLNRVEFAGVHCVRIENYFDYEGKQQRIYKERLSGEILKKAVNEFESIAEPLGKGYLSFNIQMVCKKYIACIIEQGIKKFFDSFARKKEELELPFIHSIMFTWSWTNENFQVLGDHKNLFNQTEFTLEGLKEVKEYLLKLPEKLQLAGKKICIETILHILINESRIFEKYDKIYENMRVKLLLRDEDSPSLNDLLIYDHMTKFQRNIEIAKDLNRFNLDSKDFQEFDFSGKDLTRVKIRDNNLQGARFQKSILNQVEFINCNLMGAELYNASLEGAKFIECNLMKTMFDSSDMNGVEIKGSTLEHTGFVNCNLHNANIIVDGLFCVYFYRTGLNNAVFEVPEAITGCVFRLCDIRNARFIGNTNVFSNNIEDCDFRNSDLSGCSIETRGVLRTSFVKSKLVAADFTKCKQIVECNYKWSLCNGMNIEGVLVSGNNFTHVDISQLAVKKGTIFTRNDFSYANLSGYDFSDGGYIYPNRLVYTNLSNCKLQGANFKGSDVLFANFKDAKLDEASFTRDQLQYIKLSQMQLDEIEQFDEDD